ncbi:MAG: hypothetical protein ACKO4Q_01780, partial [Planctomycetota bacterium]
MGAFFLGWDVGAWNCDRNPRSRDALCALVADGSRFRLVGKTWRGNLRELLVNRSGIDLVEGFLELVEVRRTPPDGLIIAIDAALGWPAAATVLLEKQRTVAVPEVAIRNPYLFREQARILSESGIRPLSVVRDMIGSQSLKAMHFLARSKLRSDGRGAWVGEGVVAIETYPCAARRDAIVQDLCGDLESA